MISPNSTRRHRTPDQILGPYFPIGYTPVPEDDLTTVKGIDGVAQGEIIEVTGRVSISMANLFAVRRHDLAGQHLWPVRAFHDNPAPFDPNFSVALTFDPTTTAPIRSRP